MSITPRRQFIVQSKDSRNRPIVVTDRPDAVGPRREKTCLRGFRPGLTQTGLYGSSGFPTRSDTNRPVQSQKMVRGWKFWFLEEEGLYYLCSKNKGADQLRSYREAGLRLCFRTCKLLVFSCRVHNCFILQ